MYFCLYIYIYVYIYIYIYLQSPAVILSSDPPQPIDRLMSIGETQSVDFTSRPTWVPPFAQHRHERLANCTSLDAEAMGDPNRVQMGDITQDSPGPHAAWVSCWGLPLDFVRLANFPTQEVLPLRLDSEGQVSEVPTKS